MTNTLYTRNICAYSLFTFTFLASVAAQAQTCATAPSCSELGYTKSASQCSGKTILYCPFDKTKVFCVDEITCASLGFTDTISECPGEYTLCPSDSSKGKCIFEASPGDLKYSLRTSSHNGWLLCDGSNYNSQQFPELYAAISGSFGNKLPNYSGYFLKGAATTSASTFKTYQQAGLPNITAYGPGFDDQTGTPTIGGAFYKYSTNFAYDADSSLSGAGWRLGFDASKSNSIYGRSSTVTPQNYSANVFIYAGRTKYKPSTDSCTKGNYLYSDGTCSSSYTSSKTLLGMITSTSSYSGKITIYYVYGGNTLKTSHDSVETACGCSTDSLCSNIADIYDARALVSMTIATNSVVSKPVSGRNYYGDYAFGPYTCTSSTCSQSSYSNASLTSGYYYCTKTLTLYTF